MKSVFSKKPLPDPELLALKAELHAAQGDLACAYRQFNQAVDPELVEACVYQISAVKARCNYLIRSIKERSPDAAITPISAPRKHIGAKRTHSKELAFLPVVGGTEYDACEVDGEGAVWT